MIRVLCACFMSLVFSACDVLPRVAEWTRTDSVLLKVSESIRTSIEPVHSPLNRHLQAALNEAVGAITPRMVRRLSGADGVALLRITFEGHASAPVLPHFGTDESYELEWNRDSINVKAKSISGVVYALETLTQLIHPTGYLPSSLGKIKDRPSYHHRGILVDTGRRFWPLWFLKQTIDGMAAAKMNVLHLHMSDNCRFAVESTTHPEIIPSDGQYLTKEQVHELVHYAAIRGVRILPEIDLPGHARGMRNAAGVTWATRDTKVQMSDSPGTRAFLNDILSEFADLFPDHYFHIGADETTNAPKELIDYAISVLRGKGKKVVGWEEAHFTSQAGTKDTLIVQLWKNKGLQKKIKEGGFKSIFSLYLKLYLDLRPKVTDLWLDISSGQEDKGLLGGEVAMWTDVYCPLPECYNTDKPPTVAGHLYTADKDREFAASINRMMWPKTLIAASSFWRHTREDLPSTTDLNYFRDYFEVHFGIKGCVDTDLCRCSELASDCPAGLVSPLVNQPIPRAARVSESNDKPVSLGIHPIRYPSWGKANGAIIQKYGNGPYPAGDIYAYYVDAFYSTGAFASDTTGIESFLTDYRTKSGNTDSTVWFIYDDGGKHDSVLFRHFVRRFKGFLERLDRARIRAAVGKVGIMVNTEGISAHSISEIVAQEYNSFRDANTRFGLSLYASHKEQLSVGLQLADHVVVHIGGKEQAEILASVQHYLESVSDRLDAAADSSTKISFLVNAHVGRKAPAIAQAVFDSIPKVRRERFFKPRGILVIGGWENWSH